MRLQLPSPQLIAFLALILLQPGCRKEIPADAPTIPKVTITPAISKNLVEMDEYTGRIEAPKSVEVRSQVDGLLQEVRFTDGAVVTEGFVLFVIDQRRYKAALLSAEGKMAEAQSKLALAQSEQDRATNLVKTNAISKQEADKFVSQVDLCKAVITQAQADVDKAKFDLDNTEIRAPIAGKAGIAAKQKGSLIAVDTLLTTIRDNETAWVYLDIDERAILKYQRLDEQAGADSKPNDDALDVQMALTDEGTTFPHRGSFDFSDNRIDPATGTLRARAVFDNKRGLFFPGLFARVRVPGSFPKDVILVPSEAIGSDQTRKYVFVVKSDNTVEQRTVEPGPEMDGARIIRSGLSPGENVITAGQLLVRAGGKVEPELAPPSPSATPTPVPSATPTPAATVTPAN